MDIDGWRQKIDGLDDEIVKLINERADAAMKIGELKRASDLPVYEPQREKSVFEHVRKVNQGPLSEAAIVDIYERIIDVMRTLQKRP
jgi:chorismate mutase-like protein